MSAAGRLIWYPEERALEDTAFVRGMLPARLFTLLLPVWRVDVKATVTEAEDYALIDRYLERGIGTAGLDSVSGLASFFGLDEVVVERALRFLSGIGHVTMTGGQVMLTELGQRSVRDGKRYLVTRQDRRTMYFDAFWSRPLTCRYYDSRRVTFLSRGAAVAAGRGPDWPRFQLLISHAGFRREALASLARLPERGRYNLPEGIDEPESLREECVYLPVYVVRSAGHDGRVRYLAYSQASDEEDRDLSALCEQTPEIAGVLENEELALAPESPGADQSRVREWLDRQGLGVHAVVRLNGGMVRATLPAGSFGAESPLSLSKVGSFVMLGREFFQAWCADEGMRRRALLERVDDYLGSRTRIDTAEVQARVSKIGRQLELGEMDLPTVRLMAADAGRNGLAAQLGRVLAQPHNP